MISGKKFNAEIRLLQYVKTPVNLEACVFSCLFNDHNMTKFQIFLRENTAIILQLLIVCIVISDMCMFFINIIFVIKYYSTQTLCSNTQNNNNLLCKNLASDLAMPS